MTTDHRTPMVVIFDIDDVLMPWAEKAHEACMAAGLNPDNKPWTQWEMWEDYGCAKEDWIRVVNSLVVPGGVYHAPPYPGAAEAVQKVWDAGHKVHLVTARGFFDHAEEIRQWTTDWVNTFQLPGELWFSQSKGDVAREIGATHGIDDRYENWLELSRANVLAYMQNQPHNQSANVDPEFRVDSVSEFVERILA